MKTAFRITIIISLLIISCSKNKHLIQQKPYSKEQQESFVSKIKPPTAKVIPHTIEMHGVELTDNYYWMKDKERNNQEVIEYVKAENDYTDKMLEHTEELQKKLYEEILNRIKETDMNVPEKVDDYYYYIRNEEGKQYPFLCRKKGSLDAKEEITIDLNKLAESYDFYNIGGADYSPNHRYLAYSADTTGAEKYTLYFKDLNTGKNLQYKLYPVSHVTWANDNKTLFYTKDMEEDEESPALLYRHILGTDPKKDELIYQENDLSFGLWIRKTRSKEYLILGVGNQTTREIRYLEADDPFGKFKLIHPREEGLEYNPTHRGDKFYIYTNENHAKNFKIMVTSVSNPSIENWEEFIPQRDSVYISRFDVFEDFLVIHERVNALEIMRIIDLTTNEEHYVDFPDPAYTFYSSRNSNFDTDEYRIIYTSLVTPTSVFDYNMKTKTMELLKQYEVLGIYEDSLYKSERLFAQARDGTMVPISLLYKKDLFKKNGKNPLYLYTYGAYGLSSHPNFSSIRLSLLNRGFIYAIAHVRGGKEMGETWHDQGKLLNKNNTFTDFIDCAEYLISREYTSKDCLVIEGGSAGGMLMGVVANMRPDLFKIVIASVPAVDELNHMLDPTTRGVEFHYGEWGNPNIKEQFEYMKSWDAYYNIKTQNYPNILVTAGLHDPRVPYWEPLKWIAKLRSFKKDKNILLLKTEMSGHAGASGRYDYYKEVALRYAFIFDILGIKE